MADKNGTSRQGKDWLGNDVTEHFDQSGKKTGESRPGTDLFGNPRTEHFDQSGRKTGESRPGTDLLGTPRTEHFDPSSRKVGESRSGTDMLGNARTEHFDPSSRKIGESRPGTDFLGNARTEHVGGGRWVTDDAPGGTARAGAPSAGGAASRARGSAAGSGGTLSRPTSGGGSGDGGSARAQSTTAATRAMEPAAGADSIWSTIWTLSIIVGLVITGVGAWNGYKSSHGGGDNKASARAANLQLVTTTAVKLRKEPGSSEHRGVAPEGAKVKVVDYRDGWCQVVTADGKHGWCKRKYLSEG